MKAYLWLCVVYFGIGFLVTVTDKGQKGFGKVFGASLLFAFLFGALRLLWE